MTDRPTRKSPRHERTFMLIKPDGVKRGLTGEILARLEKRGLKIVALEMIMATREQIDEHYPKDPAWVSRLGEKSLATYEKYGFDAVEEVGTADPAEIGKKVRAWLIDFMVSGPVVKLVIEGVHAVDMVRKLAGVTMPSAAELGSIRGDYSVESAALANMEKRAVQNLVHASETTEEAEHEIAHWFGKDPAFRYDRAEDTLVF